MKNFLISLSIMFLVSCSVTHHNHYTNDDDAYVRYEVVNHSYVNHNDYLINLNMIKDGIFKSILENI